MVLYILRPLWLSAIIHKVKTQKKNKAPRWNKNELKLVVTSPSERKGLFLYPLKSGLGQWLVIWLKTRWKWLLASFGTSLSGDRQLPCPLLECSFRSQPLSEHSCCETGGCMWALWSEGSLSFQPLGLLVTAGSTNIRWMRRSVRLGQSCERMKWWLFI